MMDPPLPSTSILHRLTLRVRAIQAPAADMSCGLSEASAVVLEFSVSLCFDARILGKKRTKHTPPSNLYVVITCKVDQQYST